MTNGWVLQGHVLTLFQMNATETSPPRNLHWFQQTFLNSCNCCKFPCIQLQMWHLNKFINANIHRLSPMEKTSFFSIVQWLEMVSRYAKPLEKNWVFVTNQFASTFNYLLFATIIGYFFNYLLHLVVLTTMLQLPYD